MKNLLNHIINYIMKFSVRIIIILSFLLYACDETSEIGIDELLSDQKDKIKVHYLEIPLEVSNIYFDSVRTDDGDLYFGKYDDPVFGSLKSIAYSQFIFQEGSDELPLPGQVAENYYLPNSSSQLDSAVLYLKYSKVYGDENFDEQEITVTQIEDTLFSSALYTSSRYTEISPPKGIVGFTRFKVLNKDTFLTIPITNKYGKFILSRIIDGVSDVELLDQMRGIAFVPGENNKQIVSFDLENDNSKFVLYFNNPEEGNANSPADDSLQYVFRFNSPLTKHYSYYEIDRSSTELSIINDLDKNESFNLGDKIYWQSASGIYPILDLNNFNSFLDTAKNIVFNRVELVTGPLDRLNNLSPPSEAIYYIAKDNKLNPVGIISNPVENVIMEDNAYYSNETDPSQHKYDSIISYSYKGESTVFFQELAMNNLSAHKLIAFPSFPNTLDKMVVDKDKFYMKVFYTKYKK
tara:strand:+ start:1294 stop:2685 length:1392 start_codon:yes stop_codon:yes gene_type:complete